MEMVCILEKCERLIAAVIPQAFKATPLEVALEEIWFNDGEVRSHGFLSFV